jgi:hypothetical protein
MLLCFGFAANSASAQRLLAKSHYDYVGSAFAVQDSTVYFYSGTRGLTAPNYNIDDFAIPFDSTKAYSSPTLQTNRVTQTFDASDNLLTSILQTYSGGNYTNSKKTNVIYVGSSPDTVVHQNWSTFGSGSWKNADRTYYTFTGTKKSVGVTQTAQMMGGWKNSSRTTWSYSGSNFSTILIESWVSSSSAWSNQSKTDYTTAGSNTIETKSTWDASLTAWVNATQLTRYYSAGTHLDSIKMLNWIAGNWSNVYRITYTYGSGSTPTGSIRQDADPFNTVNYLNTKKYDYIYTGNYLTQESTQTWNGTAYIYQASNDTMNRFYYGMWNIGVNNQPSLIPNDIIVYPCPANDVLYISMPGSTAGAQAEFTIMDIAGHVQKQWTDNQSVTNISLKELPAGNYIVTVSDGLSVRSERFVVSK